MADMLYCHGMEPHLAIDQTLTIQAQPLVDIQFFRQPVSNTSTSEFRQLFVIAKSRSQISGR
jgi:hypothetical protein